MSSKVIILITILFSLIVVGMFVFAYLRNAEVTDSSSNSIYG
jgi:Tfp pilus assembly protein PilX